MANYTTKVEKADGTLEPYDEEKLRDSLKHSGATAENMDYVAMHIRDELQDGMRTSTIYKHAFEELKKRSRVSAARYSLREALADLGPTGYPFEYFIAELLKRDGFETEVGVTIAGKCTSHEVDVLASKESMVAVVEAKFHNQSHVKTDLKVALYVHARFQDILENDFDGRKKKSTTSEHFLVTNTKFTSQAVTYAACRNLTLIGWSYPKKGNLVERIAEAGLQPVTVLTTLNKAQKKQLIQSGVVLCRSVRENTDKLLQAGIHEKDIGAVVEEAEGVCHL